MSIPVGGIWNIEDFTFEENEDGTATLTGLSETGSSKVKDYDEYNTDGDCWYVDFSDAPILHIPAYDPNGRKVTKIAPRAFSGNDKVYSGIYSWENIVEIGAFAFENLYISQIPETWAKVEVIGEGALRVNPIENLPRDWGKIRAIRNGAFAHLEVKRLPNDWGEVDLIEPYAFAHCRNLKIIPKKWGKVHTVAPLAFEYCNIETRIEGSNRHRSIHASAFEGNKNMKRIVNGGLIFADDELQIDNKESKNVGGGWCVEDFRFVENADGTAGLAGFSSYGIEKIQNMAVDVSPVRPDLGKFIVNLYLPSYDDAGRKVTSIEEFAFHDQVGLIRSICGGWNFITTIGEYAFAGGGQWNPSGGNIRSIPSDWYGVTSIGKGAFEYNRNLRHIPSLWKNVVEVGDSAFYACAITEVPETVGIVMRLGDECFARNEITFLSDDYIYVPDIGEYAFAYNRLESAPSKIIPVNLGDRVFYDNCIDIRPEILGVNPEDILKETMRLFGRNPFVTGRRAL